MSTSYTNNPLTPGEVAGRYSFKEVDYFKKLGRFALVMSIKKVRNFRIAKSVIRVRGFMVVKSFSWSGSL